jgi:hypothetical protein
MKAGRREVIWVRDRAPALTTSLSAFVFLRSEIAMPSFGRSPARLGLLRRLFQFLPLFPLHRLLGLFRLGL